MLLISCKEKIAVPAESPIITNECEYSNPDCYLPQTANVSTDVDGIDIYYLSNEDRLTILSLQGIVNKDVATIYTYNSSQDKWIIDLYKAKGYITSMNESSEIWPLIEKYKSSCQKCVICDINKFYQVNLATNIAGVENRIIVSDTNKDKFLAITGCNDIFDLTSMNFNSATETFKWYKENIFPKQNHNVLSVSKGGSFMFDAYIDYAIAFKLPVFWLPGVNDYDYESEYESMIKKMLKETPVNIPILGFWPGVDQNGTSVGYGEYGGVKLAGRYGKFTLVNTWVGNYSYHSGIKTNTSKFTQKRTYNKITYDKTKKYVALIMNESGDAPCYFVYRGFQRQWNDSLRGQIPLSYGISPSLRYLVPAILEDIYDTQTDNDYFYCSISGAGYCYPFEEYGIWTPDYSQCLYHYFSELTYRNMAAMDLDILGLYTHSANIKWSNNDFTIANNYISQIPNLKMIAAGMHRTGYTGDEAYFSLKNGVNVFNTISFILTENYEWDDESKDREAVDFLINEIKTYGKEAHFIQAMFTSWKYTPRRLIKVKEELEKEGYYFVTLEQLNDLYNDHINSISNE